MHHTAALAVAGWYLMVPPSMRERNRVCGASLAATVSHELFGTGDEKLCAKWAAIADTSAPFSECHETSPFETLDACEEARGKLFAERNAYGISASRKYHHRRVDNFEVGARDFRRH